MLDQYNQKINVEPTKC